MPEPQIRYCTTSDGVSIAYYEMGEGPPLVIAAPTIWGNVRYSPLYMPEYQRTGEGVGRGMRVVRYDSRGSGMSDRAALDFSMEARIRDLEAVVRKLGLTRFALAAYTYGCLCAIEYAARNPENVTRLVLRNPVVDGRSIRQRVQRWDSLRSMASEAWEEYTNTMAAANVGYDRPDLIKMLAERFRESMGPVAVQATFDSLEGINVTDLLPRLRMPVLVLFNPTSASVVPIEDARSIAAAIPDCELVTVAGGDRSILWSAEETDVVERFLGIPPLDGSAAPTPAAEPAGEAASVRPTSGVLQTILFTDIEANTELLQRVGDSAWRDVLREHERITRGILARYGGTEIKTIGDAFMTAFPAATAAIECAIALQQAHAEEGGLRIRIGINAGEPIAEADDLFGTAVTMASRIQGLARGGEILVSDVVRQLVAGKGFLFDDRGESVLRGFEDPVRLFAVRVAAGA